VNTHSISRRARSAILGFSVLAASGCAVGGNNGSINTALPNTSQVPNKAASFRPGQVRPGETTATTASYYTYGIPTANSGAYAITTDGSNNLWFTEANTNHLGRVTQSGAISEWAFCCNLTNPVGIAYEAKGNLPGTLWMPLVQSKELLVFNPAAPAASDLQFTTFAGLDPSGGVDVDEYGDVWFTTTYANGTGGEIDEFFPQPWGNLTVNYNRYPLPNGWQCINDTLSWNPANDTAMCPMNGAANTLFQLIPGAKAYKTLTLPPGAVTNAGAVQTTPGFDGYTWALDVHDNTSSENYVYPINPNTLAIPTSFHAAAGGTDTQTAGALTAKRQSWYFVGRNIVFEAYCYDVNFGAGWSPIVISYPHSPQTAPGGLTETATSTERNAWFLDRTGNAIVRVPDPQYFCPQTAAYVKSPHAFRHAVTVQKLQAHGRHVLAPMGVLHQLTRIY
jgi:hypothetical protein